MPSSPRTTNIRIITRVTCFQPGKSEVAWSHDYPSAGQRARPGAFLISAARYPDYAVDSIQALTAMGSKILVCAGPMEDLICLEQKAGAQVWRVPRIWEFTRGFIGPSVWSHYIGRFGFNDDDLKWATDAPSEVKDALHRPPE